MSQEVAKQGLKLRQPDSRALYHGQRCVLAVKISLALRELRTGHTEHYLATFTLECQNFPEQMSC